MQQEVRVRTGFGDGSFTDDSLAKTRRRVGFIHSIAEKGNSRKQSKSYA